VFRMAKALYIPATAIAMELLSGLDTGGFAPAHAWALAPPLRFANDWRGRNADFARETEVRLLWTNEYLHLRFHCGFRSLTIFADSDSNGRRDHLWDRDVAEVFLQTDASQPRRYWEFEVGPNGMWIDLEISPEGKRDPGSGMRSRVVVDESEKVWTAELALPLVVLVNVFDPSVEWRVNFFRVEGAAEPRFYSSWRPTYTPQPNFHVPDAFGILRFQKA
jgi:alpha-galactosidase